MLLAVLSNYMVDINWLLTGKLVMPSVQEKKVSYAKSMVAYVDHGSQFLDQI